MPVINVDSVHATRCRIIRTAEVLGINSPDTIRDISIDRFTREVEVTFLGGRNAVHRLPKPSLMTLEAAIQPDHVTITEATICDTNLTVTCQVCGLTWKEPL
ncbi:hypothetical protein Xcel_0546 [Xylanimonas cellulosilytica DSM 15894]|uniref:Uncharacterized protein n=1 Tax=Xylanimonas cellulosilytica (strain DSM 15894 / JCM 12276 / CECT 5975 / KCTC 9989 / LMG 20990 / NBRC 107835 / XIL07) TaxID=446471 RepID=D1BW82_XYLCX|nr:hypothetical protein [Xylanimonas cellulosilytica]ACZ29585.1 hypothetical protein Xcel_0546 [Xylanimonas cellulosilytica DSM 15894]